MPLSPPKTGPVSNPGNCVAEYTAAGAGVGAAAGYWAGGGAGALGGGVGGTLVEPVGGTAVGGVLGWQGGSALGAAGGFALGARAGYILGSILCSSSTGTGGGGGPQDRKLSPSEVRQLEAETGESAHQIKAEALGTNNLCESQGWHRRGNTDRAEDPIAMSMMTSSHDEVTVYLAIESTVLKPSVVSEQLGALPDRQWSVGEPRGQTGKAWDRHGWILEVRVRPEDHEHRTASELLPIAIEKFEERLATLVPGLNRLGSSAQKYIVASVISDFVPGIELKPSFLKLLSDAGASFQIDIQC